MSKAEVVKQAKPISRSMYAMYADQYSNFFGQAIRSHQGMSSCMIGN